MSATDIINLFAAAASTVLAIVALWLAIVFYRMSTLEAQRSQRSAEEISGSVKRLEAIFNAMYTDTFAIMKDTVTDMRAHVWRAPDGRREGLTESRDVEEDAEAKRLRVDLTDEIAKVSSRLGLAESQIGELRANVGPAIEDAIVQSRQPVIPPPDIIERAVYLVDKHGPISVRELRRMTILRRHHVDFDNLADALHKARLQGEVWWAGSESVVSESTVVYRQKPRQEPNSDET